MYARARTSASPWRFRSVPPEPAKSSRPCTRRMMPMPRAPCPDCAWTCPIILSARSCPGSAARNEHGHHLERQRPDLSPTARPRGGDDSRRRAEAGRRPAIGTPGGGRFPTQPDHGVEGISGTRGRTTRGKTQGTWHVCHRWRTRGADEIRTRTLSARGMARADGAHPAHEPGSANAVQTRDTHGRKIMTAVVQAKGLSKRYGNTVALDNVNLDIQPGRIVGLVGPNGAGKTTALKAILGLAEFDGELSVMGLDPRTHRTELMQQISFIADVAVLPRWLRVGDAVDFVGGVHPRFSREKCLAFLARTKIQPTQRVRELSKGMIVQLHLALIMAIDAKLLILDEPTLGLDIL